MIFSYVACNPFTIFYLLRFVCYLPQIFEMARDFNVAMTFLIRSGSAVFRPSGLTRSHTIMMLLTRFKALPASLTA
jgi:hypothetical protein